MKSGIFGRKISKLYKHISVNKEEHDQIEIAQTPSLTASTSTKDTMKWIDIILTIVRVSLEAVSRVVFGIIYWGEPHIELPPIKNLILLESASSLAVKIRTNKLTSVEVVKSFISRINEINPIVNCVVDTRYNEALEEAKSIDEFIRSGEMSESDMAKQKPFLGVPFTTKDCFKVKGLRQTAGLYTRKDFVADSDADVVQLMRKAGGIPLCVTNVSELCLWWESSNYIYGRTSNPYNNSRIVGGSSGGEGCLQSSCGSPIGIGSDIGGSIRMPSFFNGIFGHKPTYGIVSNAGQEPVAVGELLNFLVTGPMCRYSQDMKLMLPVLAGSNVHLLKLDEKVNITKLKYYYMEDDGGASVTTPVQKELRQAQMKVITHLNKAYGIKPQKIRLNKFKAAVPMYFAMIGNVKEAHTFCEELALKKGSVNVWLELVKYIFRLSYNTLPALCLGILEKLNKSQHSSPDFPKLLTMCADLRKELKEILGEDGVLLYPSHPTTAPYHGQPLFRPFNFGYTSIFNILGVPVTQCPLGLGQNNLPLGIQVVANHYNDHISLAVATELEKAFGGWVSPSEIL